MEMTCPACGFRGEVLEFKYLCKTGCPACGEADLRECPRCGNQCLFSRTEALELEEIEMRELSKRLAAISKAGDQALLDEAKHIISKLRRMNLRWNIPQLGQFLTERQRELFFG